jgi:hypothetical protein
MARMRTGAVRRSRVGQVSLRRIKVGGGTHLEFACAGHMIRVAVRVEAIHEFETQVLSQIRVALCRFDNGVDK